MVCSLEVSGASASITAQMRGVSTDPRLLSPFNVPVSGNCNKGSRGAIALYCDVEGLYTTEVVDSGRRDVVKGR